MTLNDIRDMAIAYIRLESKIAAALMEEKCCEPERTAIESEVSYFRRLSHHVDRCRVLTRLLGRDLDERELKEVENIRAMQNSSSTYEDGEIMGNAIRLEIDQNVLNDLITGIIEDTVRECDIPVSKGESRDENSEIIKNIIELEAKQYADEGYLDEGEQGELCAFYECLGRELRTSEWERVKKMAKGLLGEEE